LTFLPLPLKLNIKGVFFLIFNIFSPKKPIICSEIPVLSIYFRDGAIDDIKRIKGLKRNCELAQSLWVSETLISHIQAKRKPVSADLLCRVAYLLGSTAGGWDAPFKIVQTGWEPTNHQRNNMRKYNGEMEYEKYSVSKVFREEK
jgi:plasmid maintenance system antidote protein VapI